MSKSKNHSLHLTAEQFNKLTANVSLNEAVDRDGCFRYGDVDISNVSVAFVHNMTEDKYYAFVPRCMKANKAIKAINQTL